jgi:predicted nucleic acid-binding Zn ribbon protein
MERIGDLLPATARRLGLEDELRLARAAATWAAIVSELVPAAVGRTRVLRLAGPTLVVEADLPIVAQELRIRSTELLDSFGSAPGGAKATELRVQVRNV